MEDSKIIELYFSRDEEALTAAREKYSPYCSAVARNLLANREDEEEALADTWLYSWNSIPPNRPRRLGAFLCKITRNIAVTMLRRRCAQKRSAVFEPLEELSECVPDFADTESEANAHMLGEVLDGFLRSLPNEERYIFMRRYWYGDSYRDISLTSKLPEVKVKNVLQKTRKKLKEKLTEEGFFV